MNKSKLLLIINAQNLQVFEADENKSLQENFEQAYDAVIQFAQDSEVDYDGFEVVDGEFSNHHQHLYARSSDGCEYEYECDGEIIWKGIKNGDIIGDFLDLSGNVVFVRFNED